MLLCFGRLRALLLLLLCGLAGSAVAQAPPAPPTPAQPAPATPAQPTPPTPAPPAPAATPPNLTVMVVDVQALLQNSKAAKMVRSQIEQKRTEYTKEIAHQEELLRQERDKLQRTQATLTPEQLNQKGKAFQEKVGELDRNVQSKRQALEKSNGTALAKIQQAMLKIIADIAKEKKANLVLQRSELVLFDRAFDVTDEVLQKLDQEMPSLTVEFAAPEPTGTTAAAEPGETPAAAAKSAAKPKKK
jgi:outer membrane protein